MMDNVDTIGANRNQNIEPDNPMNKSGCLLIYIAMLITNQVKIILETGGKVRWSESWKLKGKQSERSKNNRKGKQKFIIHIATVNQPIILYTFSYIVYTFYW